MVSETVDTVMFMVSDNKELKGDLTTTHLVINIRYLHNYIYIFTLQKKLNL